MIIRKSSQGSLNSGVSLINIIIISLLLIISVVLIILDIPKPEPVPPVEICSSDNTYKLSIPGTVKFTKKTDASLDIYSSEDEMVLTTTRMQKIHEINLEDIATKENSELNLSKHNLNNVSNVEKLSLKNYNAYKYSYEYYDEEYGNTFYTEVIWIESEKNLYALDLEVIVNNKEKYIPLFNEIISSFEELEQTNETNTNQ